jgi:hypothetical protein
LRCDPLRFCHNYTSKIINRASQWPLIRIFQLQEVGIYITFSVNISCGFRISLAPSTLPSNKVIERWHDLLRPTQLCIQKHCCAYVTYNLSWSPGYCFLCVCIFFLLLNVCMYVCVYAVRDIFAFVIQAKDFT